ncbi:MAG: hypothetical protein ACRD4L_03915 [Pyrinomonadaceae bacterium]
MYIDTEGYAYQIQNAPSARLAINSITLVVYPENKIETNAMPLWTGGSSFPSTIARQQAGMVAPEGGFVSWFGLPEAAIAPGKTSADFHITSDAKPGFTTAYFRGGDALSFDTNVPNEAIDQLVPLISLEKDSYLTTVLGPLFPKNYSKKDLVANFYQGINMLVKFKLSDIRLPDGSRLPAAASEGLYQFTLANDSGKLDGDSPFVKEALAKLREYLTNSDKVSPSLLTEIQAKPTTPLEKEIATALALAMKDK